MGASEAKGWRAVKANTQQCCRRGVVVSIDRRHVNKVTLRRARLVLECVGRM